MERKSYSVYYLDGNRVVQGDWVKVVRGRYTNYEGMVKKYHNGKVYVELHDKFGDTFDYALKPKSFVLIKRKHFDFLEKPPQLNITDFWGIQKGKPGQGDKKYNLYELNYDSYSDSTVLDFVGSFRSLDDAKRDASFFGRWAIYEIDYFNERYRLVAFKEMNVGVKNQKGEWKKGSPP